MVFTAELARVAALEEVEKATRKTIGCDLWGTFECSYQCQGKNYGVCDALANSALGGPE